MQNRDEINDQIINQILQGYVECALWLETDDNDRPLNENYSKGDLPRETKNRMRADCAQFYELNMDLCDLWFARRTPEYTGHDFWLSRNGHGSGFWDRFMVSAGDSEEWEALGRRLQAAAERFGEAHLYIGADGEIYYFAG